MYIMTSLWKSTEPGDNNAAIHSDATRCYSRPVAYPCQVQDCKTNIIFVTKVSVAGAHCAWISPVQRPPRPQPLYVQPTLSRHLDHGGSMESTRGTEPSA